MKNLKNLGKISGKVIIFGGPYSNLQALQSLKSKAMQLGIPSSNIICTGDIIGYCAHPEEAVQFVKEWEIHSIAGNVELNIKEGVDDCGCNFDEGTRCDVLSRQWFPYAKGNVSEDSHEFVSALPEFIKFSYADEEICILHGSVDNTSEFVFRSTAPEVKSRILDQTGTNVVIGGHCGLPFAEKLDDRLWLNAGVIGMPANDGKAETWFLVLDDKDGFSYEFQSLGYDHVAAQRAMNELGLVPSYAETLTTGIWDNCDVLPEIETAMQGRAIVFDHL